MPDTDHEEKLIKNLIHGDIIAFEEVFKKFNKKIFLFAFKFLKSKEDAEGVVQEVFYSFWQAREHMKKDSNLNAYLFTITFNTIRKRFRKLSREKRHLDEYSRMMDETDREISQNEVFDLAEKANHIIEKLSPQQKKVFLLKKEKDYSTVQIAEELNISEKTVENHLYRARNFIRKALTEEGLLALLYFFYFFH
jgi:RNA polymerase sigma-19 factor, ECF subfamily